MTHPTSLSKLYWYIVFNTFRSPGANW